jgi:hypothetical protein
LNIRKIIYIFIAALVFSGCEQKLKEHPVPLSVKRELARQNNPENKAREITGVVHLKAMDPASVPKSARLFIFARNEGVKRGPPLAAKRHSMVQFPFNYTIGPADVMMEGNSFEGNLDITARLDFAGDAIASAGDILGTVTTQPGQKNIDITLDTVIEGGKNYIAGTIDLDNKVRENLPENWQLFIFARPEGVLRGPPLAVIRLDKGDFPYPFRLGQENVMMPGAVFEGNVTLTVRLDKDGDAKAGPGDIQGSQTVEVGNEKIVLLLDTLLPAQ